jgi:hypothetical protein
MSPLIVGLIGIAKILWFGLLAIAIIATVGNRVPWDMVLVLAVSWGVYRFLLRPRVPPSRGTAGEAGAAPVPAGGGSADEMAAMMKSLGIPLDMEASTPEAAFSGALVKANIYRAAKKTRVDQNAEAVAIMNSTIPMASKDPRLEAVCLFIRATANIDVDRSLCLPDLQRALELFPENPNIVKAYRMVKLAEMAVAQGGIGFYAPSLEGAVEVKRVAIGDGHEGVLRRHPSPEKQTDGGVKYLYTLAVHPKGQDAAVLYVASEVNKMYDPTAPPEERSGSHFLGVFPGQGHINMGASDEWADVEKFEARATAVAKERLAEASPA